MTLSKRWANAFLAIHYQIILLRTQCYPLIHDTNQSNWQNDFKNQLNIHLTELNEIKEVFVQKIQKLEKNAVANGKAALDTWLNEHWSEYSYERGQITSDYLNSNFNTDSNCLKWKVLSGYFFNEPANYEYKDLDLYYRKNGSAYVVVDYANKLNFAYQCHTEWKAEYINCFHFDDKLFIIGNFHTGFYHNTHKNDVRLNC